MSFPQDSFSYTIDPIQCGGGLLDYTEHEYQKVRIIEDWGHLGSWLPYTSNYCPIMSLGP